jgi:hypothetical protein
VRVTSPPYIRDDGGTSYAFGPALAITEVVAAVRLARIADGAPRPAPPPPRRWRSGREFSHALLAAVARKLDAQLALALDRLADGCANWRAQRNEVDRLGKKGLNRSPNTAANIGGLVYREHGACDECANRLHANTSTTCLQVQVRMQSGLLFRQGVPPHATDLFKNPWYRTPRLRSCL